MMTGELGLVSSSLVAKSPWAIDSDKADLNCDSTEAASKASCSVKTKSTIALTFRHRSVSSEPLGQSVCCRVMEQVSDIKLE